MGQREEMSSAAFDQVREAIIVREPKPDDVVVLQTSTYTTMAQMDRIRREAESVLRCRVLVLAGDIAVVDAAAR